MNIRVLGYTAIIWAIALVSGYAQTSVPDPQRLETRYRQLEEQMRNLQEQMRSLQAEIVAEQQAQKAPSAPLTIGSPQPQAATPQPPLTYIGRETQERQTADDQAEGAPRIDNEEIDPALRGYFRLPGTQTLIRFRGFVKTDFFYDLNMAGLWYGGIVPSSFPSSTQPKSPNSTVSIRPSRFMAEFRQPLGDDTLKTVVDWDLYGTQGRNVLNLRNFYAQYKNFLVGQTWSVFGDPDVWPDTLDFHGPPGMMGLRTPQFRYTQPLNPHHSIGISVDKSGVDTPFSTQYGIPVGTSKWPDLLAFYHFENNYGHLHVGTIFRSVGGFIPNTTVPDLRDHRTGYGISLSGAWGLGSLRDNIVFQGIGGKGIANYYNDNYGLGSDVGFDARGRLVATPTWSASGGYQHYWTNKLRSTVSYGYLRINNTASDPGSNYHISNYLTGNLIMQPSVLYLFGAEYSYASLERKDGFKWIAPRIQLTVTFFFNRYPAE